MNLQQDTDYTRIFLAVALAGLVLIVWQATVEWPRRQALAKYNAEMLTKKKTDEEYQKKILSSKIGMDAEDNPALTREERLKAAPRIRIRSAALDGSISLRGARFDDLRMVKYRTELAKDSPKVVLFTPGQEGYFAQAGWVAADGKTKVPDQNSMWRAGDAHDLTPETPVTLSWDNGAGVTFKLIISLDAHYMFSLAQRVENKSGQAVSLHPYAYINRAYVKPEGHIAFLHEGPLGVMNGALNEASYDTLKEKVSFTYEDVGGWFGMADHYWLSAIVPPGEHDKMSFSYYSRNNRDRYQADYLGEPFTVAAGASAETPLRLFAGAKELRLLDKYAAGTLGGEPITLFDRSLDFGSFYFLAKPMCLVIEYLFDATGNFGIALLIFVVLLKLAMFPLANKSYIATTQMRAVQPELLKLRERYADDQIALHKSMRELYKREKINPASGCLPVIIQLIVFLALFRGLNVVIEMRHAPFYGWIKDLSAPDPSNLFTLFGLLEWGPPSWLHLGLLPILYTVTMVIQMKQQPTPTDPVQAKMMSFMPYFLLVFFTNMASGFVIYWTWSNILSIIQQDYITRRYAKRNPKPAGAS